MIKLQSACGSQSHLQQRSWKSRQTKTFSICGFDIRTLITLFEAAVEVPAGNTMEARRRSHWKTVV